MEYSTRPELFDYLALYETEPDSDGSKRYFRYDILADEVLELTEEVYHQYRSLGVWTNLVPNESYLRYLLEQLRKADRNLVQIKEL